MTLNAERQKTACVIIIGNEILSGRTEEKNLPYLGKRLADLGIELCEARIVPDVEEAIVDTVNACRRRYDYVFTTGGIGPTHDDITAACIAKAFATPLETNRQALARLQDSYGEGELNDARRSMAAMPTGVRLIDNPISAAPGFQIENVFVLAGVPLIMQVMFEGLRDRLVEGPAVVSRAVSAYLREGDLAAPLAELQARYADVEMGSYPFYRRQQLGTTIVLRATDGARLDAAAEELRAIMRECGAEPIEGEAA